MNYKFKSGLQKTIISDNDITISFPSFHCYHDELISVVLNEPIPPQSSRHTLNFLTKTGFGQAVIKSENVAQAKDVLKMLWDKIGIVDEEDARKRATQQLENIQEDKDKEANSKIYKIRYIGGHPLLSTEQNANIVFKEDGFTLSTYTSVEVNYDQIKTIASETEKEVIERFTATRIALFGPFALAMKKRKVNNTKYLVVECNDFTLTFLDNFEVKSLMYKNLINYRKNNPSSHVVQPTGNSNLDEIKKLKELLDMGAITQEEFDTKKKELLAL